ncbi:MAG: exo-alpha-sialidase [Acidobacteria bacterium]|nr:MAG: exo-alpha-sialidase [Acidobacteriota bacterium]
MIRIAAALVLCSLVVSAAATQGPFERPRELSTPAAEGSLAPQLAAGPNNRVFLSWLEPRPKGGHRFRFASWLGERWAEPRTIYEGDDLFANWADVPAVFVSAGGRLVAHWLQQLPGGKYAYGVRMRTSNDDGATWSAPFTPHRDESATEHGFVSLVDWPAGGVGAIWLDGRQTQPGGHDGAQGGSGAMSLRATTIQPPAALGQEVLIDDRVCDCCPTAAVRTAEGVVIAYRDRTATETRDISVARFENGTWGQGRPVRDDGWKIAACPVNGPALAADGRRVALAWFTAGGDQPRVMVAFSSDGGATFGRPVKVNDATTLGRVDVEWLTDGSALTVWLESEGEQMNVRARPVFPDGRIGDAWTVARVAGTRTSGYPRVVRSGRDLIFAWRSAGPTPGIATAVARLR